jgi:hypothetical protein
MGAAVQADPVEMGALEVEAVVPEAERKKNRIRKCLVTVYIQFPGYPF